MRSKLIPIAITLFWACMMCSLVVQHILPERRRARSMLIEPQVLASQWADIHEWSWIRRENQTVGAMVLSITQNAPTAGGGLQGYKVIQNGEVDIPVLFFPQHVEFMLTMDLSPEFNVSKFIATVRVSAIQAEISGFVLGTRLFYRVVPNRGRTVYGVAELKQPLSLLSAVRPMIARQLDLIVGRSYPVDVVDPLNSANHGEARVNVVAKEVIDLNGKQLPAFRLDTTFAGVTRKSWVAADGVTLRRELLKGYVMDQADRPSVLARYSGLRRSLNVPTFDVQEYMSATRLQGPGPAPIPADVLQLVGQMVGGE